MMNKIINDIVLRLKRQSFYDSSPAIKFIDRQVIIIKIALITNFVLNLLFLILNYINRSGELSTNGFTILVSCLPAYYFLRKNQLNYAKFFVYFVAILMESLSAYIGLRWGLSHGNIEIVLIAYIGVCITIFDSYLSIFGILLNVLLFTLIKIVKYQYFPNNNQEIYTELILSFTVYGSVLFLGYFYRYDYFKLQEKNDKLSIQKLIIESQSEELKTLNTTKNRLFSIIAHDLRGPLSSLKGVMQLLDSEFISKTEFKDLSKRLQENVDNVHGMLENLLLWSLSQMDGIKPNLKPFNLNFIIDETVQLFKEISTQKRIDLTNNSTIHFQALGDEYQIRTVLRNILNNAIKFTPENGKILIESKVEKNFINLKISDTGIGIPREELPIFFSNPKLQTGTAGEKGTGFGLFLCKELVEKNGGIISVDSEFGKWTTIGISLPLMMN